jgi:hypothetical protein
MFAWEILTALRRSSASGNPPAKPASPPSPASPNFEVLLVEDNPGDVRLTELMLEATGIPCT